MCTSAAGVWNECCSFRGGRAEHYLAARMSRGRKSKQLETRVKSSSALLSFYSAGSDEGCWWKVCRLRHPSPWGQNRHCQSSSSCCCQRWMCFSSSSSSSSSVQIVETAAQIFFRHAQLQTHIKNNSLRLHFATLFQPETGPRIKTRIQTVFIASTRPTHAARSEVRALRCLNEVIYSKWVDKKCFLFFSFYAGYWLFILRWLCGTID